MSHCLGIGVLRRTGSYRVRCSIAGRDVAGRDPVLDLALTTVTPPTIGEVLKGALPGGLDATLAAYRKYVDDLLLHKYLPGPEQPVNSLGHDWRKENAGGP